MNNKAKRFLYLSFTLFDLLHLVGSVAVLIYVFITKPHSWELFAAESFVCFALSILLMVFIQRIGKARINEKEFKTDLGFSFLVSSFSLLLPEALFISSVSQLPPEEKAIEIIFFSVLFLMTLIGFVFSLFGTIKASSRFFNIFLLISSIAFVLYVPFSILYCVFEKPGLFLLIVRSIISLGALFPSTVFIVLNLKRIKF